VFTIASTSLLLRVASAAQRGRTQSVYRGGFLLGGIVGPAFGGLVIGFSIRAPFFVYAGTLVVAAVAAATLLPRELPLRPPVPQEGAVTAGVAEDDGLPAGVVPEPPHTPLRTALADPTYQAALAGNFAVGFSVLGVRSTVVPLLVVAEDGLGLAPGWVGIAFTVAAVVQGLLLCPPAASSTRSAGARAGARRPWSPPLPRRARRRDGPVTLLLSTACSRRRRAAVGRAAAMVGDAVDGPRRDGGRRLADEQRPRLGRRAASRRPVIDTGSYATALLVSAAVVAACALTAAG
jgi:hypothetical protein